MERLCEYCKQPFIPKRTDALYCSQSCKQLAYVLRKASAGNIYYGGSKISPIQISDKRKTKEPSMLSWQELNNPSIERELSELTDNKPEPSISKVQNNVYPSIENNKDYKNVTDLTVNTDKNKTEASNELVRQREEYIEHKGFFQAELDELIEMRGYLDVLEELNIGMNTPTYWVNIRYRCLVECLLTFSEMVSVNLDDLKEICNAITSIVHSHEFKSLPSDYPYIKDIQNLRGVLRNFCIQADEEQTHPFHLKRETKLKMLATRWELANFVEKHSFNQLDFDE